ncbi:hypothetical protein RN01_30410 [Cupriavidus sp. SHE]|uniref:Uncharacterized protein n=1 Tax=Cupriavidus metallidurans TaxID=119219 RepID=A0A2L0X3K7_9BURK|nr:MULTISPECIES: hypothetical protein [Cupriavidus]AVA34655.1 hypothetical protein C3Z06_14220 [Cupriavidus metallidurans]KWR74522.1 hypothetical protein RN01_30410 [Cupriavidus sp. SHE]QBP12297.1 hypothetical protein DDF84_021335 [Cupriavidus metallidurans]
MKLLKKLARELCDDERKALADQQLLRMIRETAERMIQRKDDPQAFDAIIQNGLPIELPISLHIGTGERGRQYVSSLRATLDSWQAFLETSQQERRNDWVRLAGRYMTFIRGRGAQTLADALCKG